MRLGQLILLSSIAVTLTMPAIATTRSHRGPTSAHKASVKHAAKPHIIGQRTIDDERATQIQSALIKAGYLTGAPAATGTRVPKPRCRSCRATMAGKRSWFPIRAP